MCNERRERQLTYADAPGVVEMAEREDAHINDGWLKRHAMERDEAEDKATYATTERDNALADLRREKAAREGAEAEAGMLRGLVSSAIGYISMEHEWSTDQADVWLSIATTALASGARTDTVGA